MDEAGSDSSSAPVGVLQIDIEMSADDVVRAWMRASRRRRWFGLGVLTAAVSAVPLWMALRADDTASRIIPAAVLAPFLAWVLGRSYFASRKRLRTAIRGAPARYGVGPGTLFCEPGGIRRVTPGGQSVYPWSTVQRVVPAGSDLFLWIAPGNFLPVPRSSFASAEAEQAFVALVRRYIASGGGQGSSADGPALESPPGSSAAAEPAPPLEPAQPPEPAPSSPTIALCFTLEPEDYLAFARFHQEQNLKFSWTQAGLALVLVGGAFCAGLGGVADVVQGATLRDAVLSAVSVLFLGGVGLLYPIQWLFRRQLLDRRISRAIARHPGHYPLGPRVLGLSEEGITEMSPRQGDRIAWSRVVAVEEDRDHLFLMDGPDAAVVLPKRAFDEQVSEARIRGLAAEWRASARARQGDAAPAPRLLGRPEASDPFAPPTERGGR